MGTVPSTFPSTRNLSSSLLTVYCWPWITMTARPRVTYHMPRVTRNDGIFHRVWIRPLTRPQANPMRMASSMTGKIIAGFVLMRSPETTAESAMIPSVERSIPPMSSTRVIPCTAMRKSPPRLRMFWRFAGDRFQASRADGEDQQHDCEGEEGTEIPAGPQGVEPGPRPARAPRTPSLRLSGIPGIHRGVSYPERAGEVKHGFRHCPLKKAGGPRAPRTDIATGAKPYMPFRYLFHMSFISSPYPCSKGGAAL